MQFGIEIDVATFEEVGSSPIYDTTAGANPTGVAVGSNAVWTAPAPTQTIPISVITDVVEVLVFGREAGLTLVGAIELVSPANKDRPAHRDAFITKCAAYLQQGVGLIIVDVVTDRRANLHDELLVRLGSPGIAPLDAELYAVAYHPVSRAEQASLDIWQEPVAVGHTLPTLPLWLRGSLALPLDLGATHERTCREQRINLDST